MTYTDKELEEMRNQPDPLVVYIIVRKSLNMSIGKTSVQVGHAVDILNDAYFQYEQFPVPGQHEGYERSRLCRDWKRESRRKIAKKASDSKFEEIKETHSCLVVRDAGLTEVEPGSETVLILWPMRKSQTPKLISKLQNL